ncbi:DUF3857 domain-containing protein [Flavobacterium terrigena]|uniref:Transglutaminase-like superfamily protein n=1 Tax=Flavobacterium terrigena TaxID=402734 RepID=A0A1H6SHN6_9FLAO|nr:DUF3857 domain-containing protein [Flavobacterium terrigena]SEI65394.1 Transglutaminase-like superfamily protein [Flavobacterium terrigena]
MKKLILALLFPILSLAQDYELGKVTIQELSQKQHPTDTSAVAAILFNKGKTYFDFVENSHFVLVTEVEVKIKIYKKEGLNWANKEIAYYVGGEADENVIVNKAITYNLVNGKIEKTKLNSDGEFKENVNKFWVSKKITMPNVKEGSIIEYKYTIKSPYFSNLQDWKFQQTIPVDYSVYETIIPEYYNYNFYNRGSLVLNTKKETKNRTVEISNKELVRKGRVTSYEKSVDRISLIENVTIIDAKNVPALIEEDYANNIENYLSSIQYQLASTHYPNELVKVFSKTWEDVAKNINENNSFGEELKKDNYFENDYATLVNGKDLTNEDKINKIYDFVKNHYKWNEMTGIYTDVGVNKAYKDKVGNVAEINFTLIAMLRKAGLNANPIVLTTRSQAINLFPTTTAFNYVICGVEIGDKVMFLDATDKLLKPDVLPTRALNYIGRLVRQNSTSLEIDLSPKLHAKSSVMIFASIDNQTIKGNIKETLTENRAYNFRTKNSSISEDTYLENIEKNMTGFEITEYKIENKTNEKEPLKEDYYFTATNEIEVINDKLFFKPLMFFAIDENPFKQDKRDYPIDFKYPMHDSYTITYNLPQGYVVESMPEKINITTEDNLASFSFLTGNMGNKVQIVSNFYINSALISSEYYDSLKGFFNHVYLKMNEKIVLKKQ